MQQRVSGFPDVTWHLEEGFDPAQILDLLMGDRKSSILRPKHVDTVAIAAVSEWHAT
jgi:hypothetical protein